MDPTTTPKQPVTPDTETRRSLSRRRFLKYGLAGLALAAGGGAILRQMFRSARETAAQGIFPGGGPSDATWEAWRRRGWVKEARHAAPLGRNVQCHLCPNGCVLAPGDRGHCRNRVNRDGTLYTLAYGNPCTFHVDPIEKKPLFHFLPATTVFSLATAGCVFRCLNCQNWDISQKTPEETKDAAGPSLRPAPEAAGDLTLTDMTRLTLLPADVVRYARHANTPTIAYTYSEPIAYYEYMLDSAREARKAGIRNAWITCGSIRREPLAELAGVLDAANVNLKSFQDDIYRRLNGGRLQPVLDTLVTLKERGVWFEVTNLIIPTWTDDVVMIRRMCRWLAERLGPDVPLHFSRFHPAHKLTHLPPTPAEILLQARDIARSEGLRYVYIGNTRGVADAETTFCPSCKKTVIRRDLFAVTEMNLRDGACGFCKTKIAGVWK
ncbi:MAG: AmmeMemoRadiSam system radical SAM enzyme [Planctomycetota bacterium]